MNEAGQAFNEGLQKAKAKDYTAAIESYKSCVEICAGLGVEGEDLKGKAEAQIPIAFYKMGIEQYKAKKLDNAVTSFESAIKNAEAINDESNANKSKKYLCRVYNLKGSGLYKAKKYDEAIAMFDKAKEYDEAYEKTYYSKSLVYRKQNNAELYKAEVDNLIAIGKEGSKTVAKAKSTAVKFFANSQAGKAIQAGDFKKSIEMMETGAAYGQMNAQAYFFAAVSYNNLSQFAKAVEAGNKGIALEKKSKSNIYFELGKAYEGTGNKAKACSSYKSVIDGPNAEAAKYKVEQELKCN
jgi:tetratricopeptide (TPR) repeat protein